VKTKSRWYVKGLWGYIRLDPDWKFRFVRRRRDASRFISASHAWGCVQIRRVPWCTVVRVGILSKKIA